MVPKRLKEARKAAGMSQEQLSQLVDVEGINSRSRLSSYEVGRTEPPFSLVVKIAKALGVPEYYFYTLDDAVAREMLDSYRNRMNPKNNTHYYLLAENKKLREQRDNARRLLGQLSECLKD